MKDPLLELRNVRVAFGGVVALDDVSLELRSDEILGLIGPNGAGKSSLFNCLSRLYKPDSGEILLDGKSILRREPHEMARLGIGRTFQNISLFQNLSVMDNICIGGHARTRGGIVGGALRLPSARRDEKKLHNRAREIIAYLKLEEVAARPVSALPFGTQKLVELGRALATEPTVLLLDEPACGLNHEEVYVLGALIRRMRDDWKLAVLLVEHHMGLVMSLADRVVALNFGKKLAEGTPKQIQRDPLVITAYLGSSDHQAEAYVLG